MRQLLILFLCPALALADRSVILEYGVGTTVDICLPDYESPVDWEDSATFAAGDVTVMKDEGAPANIGTLPTDEGDCYSFPLTATEMQAARIVVKIEDQTASKAWADTTVYIDTYGNASSQHPDLAIVDDATRIDASALNTAATAVGSDGTGLTEAGGTGDQFTALNDPTAAAISNQLREDAGALRCTVNDANNTLNTTSIPCIMTDPAGNAWSGANDAMNNKRINLITVATPAPYQGDFSFISDTTWDAVNSELVLTISPALSAALEDGDVVEIVP